MGENEQGGMLRVVVVLGLIALIAAVVIGGVVYAKNNMQNRVVGTASLIDKAKDDVTKPDESAYDFSGEYSHDWQNLNLDFTYPTNGANYMFGKYVDSKLNDYLNWYTYEVQFDAKLKESYLTMHPDGAILRIDTVWRSPILNFDGSVTGAMSNVIFAGPQPQVDHGDPFQLEKTTMSKYGYNDAAWYRFVKPDETVHVSYKVGGSNMPGTGGRYFQYSEDGYLSDEPSIPDNVNLGEFFESLSNSGDLDTNLGNIKLDLNDPWYGAPDDDLGVFDFTNAQYRVYQEH